LEKDLARRVLVCGSPERAALVASRLTGSRALAKNREYHSYLGEHRKTPILVTSHGVGSAGAAICFQELIDLGAQVMVRVGTCGGLTDDSKIGDLVVATGAVRKDGVSVQMIPAEFPALPDLRLTLELQRLLSSAKARAGIVLTGDVFYPGLLDTQLELYKRAGVLAAEMECATLFVIGHLRGVRTAAVLAVDGNPLKWKEGQYDPTADRLNQSIDVAIQAALDVLSQPS
jgi:uridine phosphorylase